MVKKRGTKKGGVINDGIYNITNPNTKIRFFADLEGMMPEEIAKLIHKKDRLLDSDEVIVFTGDLIDRGPRSIRNLSDMYLLKINNNDNVILTCGNRDLNKIRCKKEFWVNEIEKVLNENDDKTIIQLFDLIKKIKSCTFKYNADEIQPEVNIPGINPLDKDDFITKYSNDLVTRVNFIYNSTFGAPGQINFFKEEYNELFDIILSNDYNTCLFICMMNMIMSASWNNKNLLQYNNLYTRYLQNCHIMAKIIFDDKIIFASHSGIPYYENSFIIPQEIGKKPEQTLSIDKNIIALNTDFKNFINDINTRITNDKRDFNIKYKKYIALSAACGIFDLENDETINSELSPVVTISSLNTKGPLKYIDKPIIFDETRKYIKIYNIFGHQPSGFLPGVMKVDNENRSTYHIDLDISKAENRGGISNKTSYVYLEITNESDMLIGFTNGKILGMFGKDTYDILDILQSPIKGVPIQDDNTSIIIKEYKINLDDYNNKKYKKTYEINNKGVIITPEVLLFTVDDKNYYGACSQNFNLLRYTISQAQDGGKNKNYKKSNKKFINGKMKRVIYLGKRGGEYVKVKGEYITLNKYKRMLTKK